VKDRHERGTIPKISRASLAFRLGSRLEMTALGAIRGCSGGRAKDPLQMRAWKALTIDD